MAWLKPHFACAEDFGIIAISAEPLKHPIRSRYPQHYPMSDSLKDQLLQAGFKSAAPAQEKPNNKRRKPPKGKTKDQTKGSKRHQSTGSTTRPKPAPSGGNAHAPTEADLAILAEKKAVKEKIKVLIEANCVKDYAGTETFGFLVGKRVRQLYVKEEHRKSLSDGELVITRLNGNTYLVPTLIGNEILTLNSDWAVINNESTAEPTEDDSDYAGYEVPDDLQW